jgi:glucans biosynthesis protein C
MDWHLLEVFFRLRKILSINRRIRGGILNSTILESKVLEQKTLETKTKRIYFIDNLKIFLIILVIVHHVGQAYGPTGGFWPYKSSLNESMAWLGSFFPVNASFFMGLFFMISGYFVPYSYDKKGGNPFLNDKLIRFGRPLLFGFLIIQPLQLYFYYSLYSGNMSISFLKYFQRIYLCIGGRPDWFKGVIGWPEMNLGHLWFVQHLLVYSIIYYLFRTIIPKVKVKEGSKSQMYAALAIITLLIASISAIVRIWYPIDMWIGIFGFIQSEVAHLPQYMLLFMTGIIAYRKRWFMRFEKKVGYTVLSLGLFMAMLVYCRSIMPAEVRKALYSNWAFYETFMAVFLCWGLIVLFREKFYKISPIKKFLSDNAYAAYIFHMPIVLAIQYSLDRVSVFGAFGKFTIVSLLSIIITFIASHYIRKIPFMKRIA